MHLRNTQNSYGKISRNLHRLLIICVITVLVIGMFMDGMPKPVKIVLITIHEFTGLLAFLLAILFLIWNLLNPKPEYPATMKTYEKTLAKIARFALYAAVIILPILGALLTSAAGKPPNFFGLFTMPPLIAPDPSLRPLFKEGHSIIAWILCGLIVIHILASLKHHFIDKDDVLKRMVLKGE